MTTKNTFFKIDTYINDIGLDINEDVLERIYQDNISSLDKLKINFAFVTDTLDKANSFAEVLKSTFKNYSDIKVQPYDELFEITGMTSEIQMTIEEINKWNQTMWDFGYTCDCKLDGWEVGV